MGRLQTREPSLQRVSGFLGLGLRGTQMPGAHHSVVLQPHGGGWLFGYLVAFGNFQAMCNLMAPCLPVHGIGQQFWTVCWPCAWGAAWTDWPVWQLPCFASATLPERPVHCITAAMDLIDSASRLGTALSFDPGMPHILPPHDMARPMSAHKIENARRAGQQPASLRAGSFLGRTCAAAMSLIALFAHCVACLTSCHTMSLGISSQPIVLRF